MAPVVTCSFCTHRPDEVPHLVVADRGTAICWACARICVEICAAADAAPVTRFPRPEVRPVVGERIPDTRHLDAFVHYAGLSGLAGLPDAVLPWAKGFLEVYETAVLDAARDPHLGDSGTLVRDNHLLAVFDTMMAPYRGDSRRAYLGAIFSNIMGRSIRESFTYHVDMTVLVAPAATGGV